MIGLLNGTVRILNPERVIVEVAGVGYLVRVPLSTFYVLERLGPGVRVELRIHTHVREEALDLFGFATEEELHLFERLIAVSGIGPRLAQSILSGMPTQDVLVALAAGDAARLQRIPGVGRKTAERLVLELREVARSMVEAGDSERPTTLPHAEQDLIGALLGLGYKASEVDRVAATVRREHPNAAFGELLRLALRSLSRV